MREIFPFEKLGKYPHMKPRDVEIWNRFIDQFPDVYTSCQYDFEVGDPPPFNTLNDEDEDWNQDKLYRMKIDVIGHYEGGVDIIEVKPSAEASTVGQVRGYRNLYIRDEGPKGKVNMVIVTDELRTNMEFIAKSEGVKLIVV